MSNVWGSLDWILHLVKRIFFCTTYIKLVGIGFLLRQIRRLRGLFYAFFDLFYHKCFTFNVNLIHT